MKENVNEEGRAYFEAIIIIIVRIISVRKVCCFWSPAINRSPTSQSHFHPFLSLSLHYHYGHYDWSRHSYLNCPQHHQNTLELMTTSRRGGKGGLLMQK